MRALLAAFLLTLAPDAGAPDSDGDGVPDDVDLCPYAPGPSFRGGCPAVDAFGPTERIEIRERVFFAAGKSTFRPQDLPLLDAIAAALKDHPELKKVHVLGHSGMGDARGLDLQRAERVVDALVERGVARFRLDAVGRGYSHTDEHDGGRRVDFDVEQP